MKIPEPFFVIINPIVRTLLRSPLHFVLSGSLLLITYTGRRSGRGYTIPLRYVRLGETIRCFTTADASWWRNLAAGADVSLRIAGREQRYRATVLARDPGPVRAALQQYLALFPQDAAYHAIRLNRDHSPVAEDLDRACQHAVVVEARLA